LFFWPDFGYRYWFRKEVERTFVVQYSVQVT
jgi:hypothetical protein